MKAAVFHGPGQDLTIEDVDIGTPMAREVLVRVVASGVCHSDLHFIDGLYPTTTPGILGHEVAGIVEAVGDAVTYVQPGDPVVACLSVFCGVCDKCLSGRPNLCLKQGTRRAEGQPPRLSWRGEPLNQNFDLSGFAEKMLVHENALAKVRPDFPLEQAALLGCSVTTGVGAVLNTAKVEAGATVAVFGVGGIGLAAIQGARIAAAATIIAVDISEAKLGLAREVGATHAVNASERDPVEAIRDLTGGGADYTFEAIGLKLTAEQAFECLGRGGTATVMGMIPVGQKVELPGNQFLAEKKIQGSLMGSNRFRTDMPRYIEFARNGLLDLGAMISHRRPLDEINEAFRGLRSGDVTRTVLQL